MALLLAYLGNGHTYRAQVMYETETIILEFELFLFFSFFFATST